MTMDKRLYVSASAMGHYQTCSQKFYLARKWRVHGLEKPKYFAVGDEVHQIMAGELAPEKVTHPEAAVMAQKLRELETNLDLQITERELWQRVNLDGMEIGGGKTLGLVTLTRVIDGIGVDWKDEPIMVDYKTSAKPWDEVLNGQGEWVAPQAIGTQATLYTLQGPHQENYQPNRIIFLVATSSGDSRFHVYTRKAADISEVLLRIWQIQRDWINNEFPKSRGYFCTSCPWAAACYKSDGWKQFYTKMKEE